MDALREHDLRVARETPVAVKLREALEMMALGIRLEQEKLARLHPGAPEAELRAALEAWLFRRDAAH